MTARGITTPCRGTVVRIVREERAGQGVVLKHGKPPTAGAGRTNNSIPQTLMCHDRPRSNRQATCRFSQKEHIEDQQSRIAWQRELLARMSVTML